MLRLIHCWEEEGCVAFVGDPRRECFVFGRIREVWGGWIVIIQVPVAMLVNITVVVYHCICISILFWCPEDFAGLVGVGGKRRLDIH